MVVMVIMVIYNASKKRKPSINIKPDIPINIMSNIIPNQITIEEGFFKFKAKILTKITVFILH